MSDDRTYRTMAHTMGPVDVERPEWAQRYAVGDDFAFRHPGTPETLVATVAGFSSTPEREGWPVFDALGVPEFDGGSVAVSEEYHIPPAVLDHVVEDAVRRL